VKTKFKKLLAKCGVLIVCIFLIVGCCAEKQTDTGLYVPPVELPETGDGVDSIGILVYNEGVYLCDQRYINEEIAQIEHLIGDHLGETSGSINIGAGRSEDSEIIASNLKGDAYTVNGYNPDFMICVRSDESVANADFLWFLYRLNDITVANGEDIFEDRLNMRDRIVSVQWQSHEDWNYEKENLQNIIIKKSVWKDFLRELYNGEFMLTYKFDKNHPNIGFYEDIPSSDLLSTPNQTHLYINLDDGTTIELRLCEGGYVVVFGFAWDYCIYMPCEVFDELYALCGGVYEPGWVVAK